MTSDFHQYEEFRVSFILFLRNNKQSRIQPDSSPALEVLQALLLMIQTI